MITAQYAWLQTKKYQEKRVEKILKKLNKQIKKAIKQGRTQILWDKYGCIIFFDSIKEEMEKLGYTIKKRSFTGDIIISWEKENSISK